MKKYEVEVYRDVRQGCIVKVEAKDEDAARTEAERAACALPDSSWSSALFSGLIELGTFDCTEIKETR